MAFEVNEAALDSFMNFGAEIFDAHCIKSMEVRRAVCRQMLQDASFVDIVSNKYDLESLSKGGGFFENTAKRDGAKKTLSLTVGLTNAQKAILVARNQDYNIVFRETSAAPHALAYAQRIVDTERCAAAVNYRDGVVLDIGGNYATHAMHGDTKFHCCTLRDDVEEHHRQTQRDVLLQLGEYVPPNFCVNGVENCDVMALEAICIHTLPRIDPALLPSIFRQHGLKFVRGVHHYDIAMDYDVRGYMPDVEMHWELEEESGDVVHYFRNDSSYPYRHKMQWLQLYAHNNLFTEPDWEYVINYQVDRIEGGVLTWTMVKMEKATLGIQTMPAQYRYKDSEEKLVISVPVFDEKSGFSIKDPRAYNLEHIQVDVELFQHVYKIGMSNHTMRPDLPLSLDSVRDLVQTFSVTRKISGTAITKRERLPSVEMGKVALGIYLIVLQRTAAMRMTQKTYTQVLINIQKKWGDENFFFMAAKCFSSVVISPFLMLAESFEQATELMAVHMRATINSSRMLASVNEELPYYLISPVSVIPGTAHAPYERSVADVEASVDIEEEDIDINKFYSIFKEELSDKHRRAIEERIEQARLETEARVKESAEVVESDLPEVQATRESWDDARDYFSDIYPNVPLIVKEAPHSEVMEHFAAKIYEAGLYHFDVALLTHEFAKARCQETWTGTGPNIHVVERKNIAEDLGLKYLKVEDYRVLPNQQADEYAVCMDPNTLELLEMPKTFDAKLSTHSSHVFVVEAFKVFNGYSLGKKLVDFARKVTHPSDFQMVLVDGVPGCGKTHEILQSMTTEDIIACAVRDTADSTRARLKVLKPEVNSKRVRTIHSLIMHSAPRARVLYVDEGLMALPGELWYIAMITRCKEVRVFGDSAQIGFIDRGTTLGSLRFSRVTAWDRIEYRNLSVRVPADVCFVMRQFYPEHRRKDIKTASNVRRSMSYQSEPNQDSVVYKIAEPGVKVMTFLRADKGAMLFGKDFIDSKRLDGKKPSPALSVVSSVHETQGDDGPHFSIVRKNAFTVGIFSSKPHQLVSLTRHTHTLKVIGVMLPTDDPLMQIVQTAMDATEAELDECCDTTPAWLKVKLEKVPARGIITATE